VQFSRHHQPTQKRQFSKNTSCLHQPRHLFSPNVFKNTAADARAGLPRASISARQEGQVGKICSAMLAYCLRLRTTIVCRVARPVFSAAARRLDAPISETRCRRVLDYDAYRRQVIPRLLCRCTCATAAALRCHHFNTYVSSGSAFSSLVTGRFHDCRKAWNTTPRVRRRRIFRAKSKCDIFISYSDKKAKQDRSFKE
jgi:hypothetical protein